MMSILFPSPTLLVGCKIWLGSTLEAAAFLCGTKLSLVGTCIGSSGSKGKVDTETEVTSVTPSLGCDAGCGALPTGETGAGRNTVFYSHTHTVATRSLGLLVCRLLIYLLLGLVVLLKSCCNILS